MGDRDRSAARKAQTLTEESYQRCLVRIREIRKDEALMKSVLAHKAANSCTFTEALVVFVQRSFIDG